MNAGRRRAFIFDLGVTADAIRQQLATGRSLIVISDYWGKLAFFLLVGIIVFVLAPIAGTSRDTVTAFTFVVLFTMRPISVLLNTLPAIGKATVAMGNIKELALLWQNQFERCRMRIRQCGHRS